MNIPEIESNFRELDDILYREYVPNVISTAMELGLFDALFEEPMDARTLSHIAAYGILYDLRIKLAQKLGTLPLGLLVITRQPFGPVVIEIDDIEIAIGRGMAGKICVEVIA